MCSDLDTFAYTTFDNLLVQQSPRDDAAQYAHGVKVLIWIGLVGASWGAVIAACAVWSAL
jgi:hypothetical protein